MEVEQIIAPEAPSPVALAPSMIATVSLSLPEVERGGRLADRTGLLLGLLELGLTDLAGVVPSVGDAVVSPGLSGAVRTGAESWTGALAVLSWEPLALRLRLCDDHQYCEDHLVDGGSAEEPAPAVAGLLQAVSARMGRAPSARSAEAWPSTGTGDPYAALLAGRSAAVVYGLREGPPDAVVGDKRADPVRRAVYVDPGLPVASWLGARRDARRGELLDARQGFGRAGVARPGSVVLLADEATVTLLDGKPALAWRLWREVDLRAPGDLRFVLPLATAALEAGEVAEAWSRLIALPAEVEGDPGVAALRVRVAEALGDNPAFDELLSAWQRAVPRDPAPVQRRIQLRLDAGRYQDAESLVDDLARRGRPEQAAQIELALAAALGRWEEAASRAEAQGLGAGRIRARAALQEGRPVELAGLRDDPSPAAQLLLARAALDEGRSAEAIALSRQALLGAPRDAEAYQLLGEAQGSEEGADSLARAARLQPQGPPFVPAGPSTAPGETGTGVQAQGAVE